MHEHIDLQQVEIKCCFAQLWIVLFNKLVIASPGFFFIHSLEGERGGHDALWTDAITVKGLGDLYDLSCAVYQLIGGKGVFADLSDCEANIVPAAAAIELIQCGNGENFSETAIVIQRNAPIFRSVFVVISAINRQAE